MSQRSPDMRGRSGFSPDTFAAILTNLQTLTQQVASLVAKFDTLSDTFMPRRELTAELTGIKEKQSDIHARLTAMEEWRLAETQRQAQATMGVQQQITHEAKELTNTSFQNRLANMGNTNAMMVFFMGALLAGFIGMLVYIAQHH